MAKRDKLTQRQKRQIARSQKQKLAKEQELVELGDLSPPQKGLLSSRYGEQADVISLDDRQTYRCYLRQNLGAPVPGDQVQFRLSNNGQGVVEAILSRKSELTRPAQHQGVKPVVANIDNVFIVIAPLPDFSSTLLDRYLVAVESAGLKPIIVANKWDLEDEIATQEIEEQLEIYARLNYPLIKLSAKTNLGVASLMEHAEECHSILVGQSGVGKSSLINRLFPSQESLVNQVSENSRLGQHTTTASRLFLFENCEGFIVDSPGVREFGLWHMEQEDIAEGFIEFRDYIGGCRFRDCKHRNEPGCEIINAVKSDKISEQRWVNYCKILDSLDAN